MKYLELNFTFLLGGAVYAGIEILWRGYTHWTMFIAGGLCFTLLYVLTTHTSLPMLVQCVLGALIITTVEFLVGCVVNLALGWAVWDYSGNRFNLLGQVCLTYAGLWLLLCWPALLLAKAIHTYIFVRLQ